MGNVEQRAQAQHQEQTVSGRERAAYAAPRLTHLGRVRDLTAGGNSGSNADQPFGAKSAG